MKFRYLTCLRELEISEVVLGDVVDLVELLRLVGATVPGLTDGKEGTGRWTKGSKPGTGYLGLPPIKVVKSYVK